ncbi:MAG: deoxyguanosinetriphosphate triphosphohydrolase [Actinobacteria bacterium]|nr:deoxyguanosinetriphosphate triphosphohydrolase [Actinomycetota bacterium]
MAGYPDAARERRVLEPPKRAGSEARERGEFARDRARVLHSYAFRRLADKTQVVGPGEDDFPRTRLTHSLEVAQIGRELASALGCDADVVDAAGLAHDLGHPPFGHNGEQALNEMAGDIGGFEGNAQTLRILTRLEPKVASAEGQAAGLNLTRATLDATCKYPWPARAGVTKFGAYPDDLDAFGWIRGEVTDGQRCLEAQAMDWADDVAYSVHDVEDGVHSGLIRLGDVDERQREQLCVVAADLYSSRPAAELAPVLDALLDLPALRDLAGYDASYLAQAAAKRATSELTGRFVTAAISATRARHGAQPLARYDADLIIPATTVAECALLKAVAAHFVMRRPGADELLAGQRRLLSELVEAVAADAPATLDRPLADAWQRASDDSARLRVVIDRVAQLTDGAARRLHTRLCPP